MFIEENAAYFELLKNKLCKIAWNGGDKEALSD